MAAVHIYARVLANVTNDQAWEIHAAYEALQAAVVSAGGEWRGSATVEPDPEPLEDEAEADEDSDASEDELAVEPDGETPERPRKKGRRARRV